MIAGLPLYVSLTFVSVVVVTYVLVLTILYGALPKLNFSNTKSIVTITGGVLLGWLILQGGVAYSGFYLTFDTQPFRIFLALVPGFTLMILAIFGLFGLNKLAQVVSVERLTYLHTIRIPVELVLLWLFQHQAVPQLMTFEGRNFDILAGLTAPLIAYFCFTNKQLSTRVALIWNFLALALLLNIVTHGILSVPTPFQVFGLEQPNIGLAYWPFIWLPAFIVPVVFIAHVFSIKQLWQARTASKHLAPQHHGERTHRKPIL